MANQGIKWDLLARARGCAMVRSAQEIRVAKGMHPRVPGDAGSLAGGPQKRCGVQGGHIKGTGCRHRRIGCQLQLRHHAIPAFLAGEFRFLEITTRAPAKLLPYARQPRLRPKAQAVPTQIPAVGQLAKMKAGVGCIIPIQRSNNPDLPMVPANALQAFSLPRRITHHVLTPHCPNARQVA